MEHIGIDAHKKESQIGILTEGGEVFEQSILAMKHTPKRMSGPRRLPR